jgi:hypothetical protein
MSVPQHHRSKIQLLTSAYNTLRSHNGAEEGDIAQMEVIFFYFSIDLFYN